MKTTLKQHIVEGVYESIDRRFAAFASNCEAEDAVYDIDLSKDEINNKEAKSHLFDYIKLVAEFNQTTNFNFPYKFMDVLTDIIPLLKEQEIQIKSTRYLI